MVGLVMWRDRMGLDLATPEVLKLNIPDKVSFRLANKAQKEGGSVWHWTGSGILPTFLVLSLSP